MRISDAWYIISEFWNTAATGTPKDHPLGWLSMAVTVKGGLDPAARPLMELVDVNTEASGIITASYLEVRDRIVRNIWCVHALTVRLPVDSTRGGGNIELSHRIQGMAYAICTMLIKRKCTAEDTRTLPMAYRSTLHVSS